MTRWHLAPDFFLRATGFPVEDLLAVAAAAPAAAPRDRRLDDERRMLFSRLLSDSFREALLTTSPNVDANLDVWNERVLQGRRNAQDRKRERVLWRFLQRLTLKNDSASFFGAVSWGRFDLAARATASPSPAQPPPNSPVATATTSDPDAPPAALDARLVPLPVEEGRRLYVTQWTAEAILERALADLSAAGVPLPSPRRAPGVDHTGRRWQPARTGLEPSDLPATVSAAHLPTGLVDPLAHAAAVLRSTPSHPVRDRWLSALATLPPLVAAVAASAHAPAQRRTAYLALDDAIKSLTNVETTRHSGEFYASRASTHEQAERTRTPLHLGSWAETIALAVPPVLDLAFLQAACDRLSFRAWFDQTFPAATPILWRDVLRALAAAPHGPALASSPAVRSARATLRACADALRASLDAAPPTHEFTFALEHFDPISGALAALAAAHGSLGTAYANPDLMLLPDPTDPTASPRVLLAEAHHLPHLTNCLIPSLSAAPDLIARTRASLTSLTAPAAPAFPVYYDHSFISVSPDLGAVGLELSGLAQEPPERRATFADLSVTRTAAGFRFSAPSHAGHLLELCPLTRAAQLWLASEVFPIHIQDFASFLLRPGWRSFTTLPRLAVGPLIVHRRRFRLDPADLASPTEPLASALARRHDLPLTAIPRFMFARTPSEPKPIAFDWDSELASDVARAYLARGEALDLSEALPAPDNLWLRSPLGHHTSELRTVWTRRAT